MFDLGSGKTPLCCLCLNRETRSMQMHNSNNYVFSHSNNRVLSTSIWQAGWGCIPTSPQGAASGCRARLQRLAGRGDHPHAPRRSSRACQGAVWIWSKPTMRARSAENICPIQTQTNNGVFSRFKHNTKVSFRKVEQIGKDIIV